MFMPRDFLDENESDVEDACDKTCQIETPVHLTASSNHVSTPDDFSTRERNSRDRSMSPAMRSNKLAKQRELLQKKRKARTTGSGIMRKQSIDNVQVSPNTVRSNSNFDYDDSENEVSFDKESTSSDEDEGGKDSIAQLKAQGIAPIFDPTEKRKSKVTTEIDLSDIELFLTSPCPKNQLVQCSIVRCKSGLKKMFPRYDLFYGDDNHFLMCAKKRTRNKTSNYLISRSRDQTEKGNDCYVGKVRANFVGTEFVAYDDGVNPKKLSDMDLRNGHDDLINDDDSAIRIRKELCAVLFQSNILGSRGPRKMTVIIPRVSADGYQVECKPKNVENGLLALFRNDIKDDVMCMHNKTPKWNEQVGAYVLNFNGRVTMASVKNFQIVLHEESEDQTILQFGRVAKDEFTMDFRCPLSPFQAFAICLTSFDYKLACE